MGIDAHIAGSAREAFVFPVRYVFVSFRVYVLLGKTKVYNVNYMLFPVRLPTDEKVLWLDVAVDEVLGMYVFHAGDLEENTKKWSQYARKINSCYQSIMARSGLYIAMATLLIARPLNAFRANYRKGDCKAPNGSPVHS